MKILIVATSRKPPKFFEELQSGQRYRLEYIDLSRHMATSHHTSFMDYDPPWIHNRSFIRMLEEKIHLDFFWAYKIARIVSQQEYDLVISMSERVAVPLGNLLNRRVKHIAILINTHSPRWLSVIRQLGVHRRWDRIITYSHAEAQALQDKINLDPGKITTVHNYVDCEFFSPSKAEPYPDTEQNFIMSQGLAKRDYATLIEAMASLPHIPCQISAVSAWDKFKSDYEGIPIPENVVIKSYDQPVLIREALTKCRFLVIPLRPDTGMWCSGSTSVLQAQAMGKPVIVTFLPGIAEYIQDNETGFLVEGRNPAQLAEKIDNLWCSRGKSEEMGKKGQAWVRESFTLQRWIEKIASIVGELQ